MVTPCLKARLCPSPARLFNSSHPARPGHATPHDRAPYFTPQAHTLLLQAQQVAETALKEKAKLEAKVKYVQTQLG